MAGIWGKEGVKFLFMNKQESEKWLAQLEARLNKIYEWKKLQEKQPEHRWESTHKLGWEVLRSDYEDERRGTGIVVYKAPRHGRLRVEIWKDYVLSGSFAPLYDLERYLQICDEKGWTPEAII